MNTLVLLCFLLYLVFTAYASISDKVENSSPSSEVSSLDTTTERVFFRSTSYQHFFNHSQPQTSSVSEIFLASSLRAGVLISRLQIHPLVRFFQAHHPVDPHFLNHPLLLLLVRALYSLPDEDLLTRKQRTTLLQALLNEGIFTVSPQDVDEGSRYLLGHYFGRRVLSLVAPILDDAHFSWLASLNPDLLALNHEVLMCVKKFDQLPIEVIEKATRAQFDFTAVLKAAKTMSPEGLFAFLFTHNFHLSKKQITFISTRFQSFHQMILAYPICLQAFMQIDILKRFFGNVWDAYEIALRPLFLSYSSDINLRNTLIAYYHLTENVIVALLDSLIFESINVTHIEALKNIFAVRRKMIADCAAVNDFDLVALMKVSTSYIVAKALSDFFVNPSRLASHDAFAQLSIKVPRDLGEQIEAVRQILECFDVELLPYDLNVPARSTKVLLKVWSDALRKSSNVSYKHSHWYKQFIFDLLDEQVNICSPRDLEGQLGTRMWVELMQLSSDLFTIQDLEFLKKLPEKFHRNQLAHSSPIASLTDFRSFEAILSRFLQKRSDVLKELDFCNSVCFVNLSKVDASIESLLKSVISLMSFEKFIKSIQSSALFQLALKTVPQVLNASMIAEMLSDTRGIAFLKQNPKVLYNLTSYQFFDYFNFVDASGFDDFDVEAVGVGLNTFAPELLAELLARKEWRLNDPAAFLWRLSPKILTHPHLKLLLLNNFTAQTWAMNPMESKNLDLQLKGIDLVGSLGEITMVDILKWHVQSELRFLEIVAFKNVLVGSSGLIFATEAASIVLINQYLDSKLRKATSATERALLSRVKELISMPLSDARASVILALNNHRTAPESLVTLFRPFAGKFTHMFESFVKWAKRSRAPNSLIAAKLAANRRECLDLATMCHLADPVFIQQIELLGTLSLSLNSFNPTPSSERKLHAFLTGDLPAWQKQIVALLAGDFEKSISELGSVAEIEVVLNEKLAETLKAENT